MLLVLIDFISTIGITSKTLLMNFTNHICTMQYLYG